MAGEGLSKKLALAACVAAAMLVTALVATAWGAVPSKVTLTVQGAHFKGKVTSPKPRCVVGRKVLIKRPQPGKDPVVTRTFASESGNYDVLIPMQNGQRLYAKIRRYKPPGRNFYCARDRSRTVTG